MIFCGLRTKQSTLQCSISQGRDGGVYATESNQKIVCSSTMVSLKVNEMLNELLYLDCPGFVTSLQSELQW